MTNDADTNEIQSYERLPNGTLLRAHRYHTGGRGSGGTVDPLASQGSLTLSDDGSLLFAANAGSGSVSVFRVFGDRLFLSDEAPSGGSEPNSIAQHGNVLYVLNTAGSSSVVGFRVRNGKLTRIPDSQRFLSANFVEPGSVAFSKDGRYLVVTEKTTNNIDVFRVESDGTLAPKTVNHAVGAGTFSALFAPNGALLVSETGTSAPNSSTISSYAIGSDGKLLPISAQVPTLGGANCWNVVTPDGRFVYASNAGSSSIAGFAIGQQGNLTPISGTVVGLNPANSANLDVAVSQDGAYLYSLNGGSGAIGIFKIERDGHLTNFGTLRGLPAGAGLNGIAAN
ncbi:MAG: beta-propeller fold lactonase family protein [Proteobacteria bacterium]|nr:beta-propeller fold lactonase family protein [Pseudomonadota bacterium]